ncbi:MAG: DUF4293 domain-containing protein [Ferruginibacter sp.]
MLQRIQTIWLLLAAVFSFMGFKFSFYSGTFPETGSPETYKNITGISSILLIIVTTAVGVLALITLFLYKNRPLQLKLSIAGIALQALVLFLYYNETSGFIKGTFSLTAIIQALVPFFFLLAAKGIRHDEKIIKESDRLR